MKVGDGSTGNGTATITDDGSSLEVGGGLTVGGGGTGTMLINGADVSVSGDDITVGDSANSSGILTINAATLDFDGELKIGESGSGTVIAQLGATLSPGTITIGDNAGAVGELDVDGSGTSVTSDDLTVGSSGQGTLKITNGGMLDDERRSGGGGPGLDGDGDAGGRYRRRLGHQRQPDVRWQRAGLGDGSRRRLGRCLRRCHDGRHGDRRRHGHGVRHRGEQSGPPMVSNLEFGKTLTIGNQGSATLTGQRRAPWSARRRTPLGRAIVDICGPWRKVPAR